MTQMLFFCGTPNCARRLRNARDGVRGGVLSPISTMSFFTLLIPASWNKGFFTSSNKKAATHLVTAF
jgi:hypothetical protein